MILITVTEIFNFWFDIQMLIANKKTNNSGQFFLKTREKINVVPGHDETHILCHMLQHQIQLQLFTRLKSLPSEILAAHGPLSKEMSINSQ